MKWTEKGDRLHHKQIGTKRVDMILKTLKLNVNIEHEKLTETLSMRTLWSEKGKRSQVREMGAVQELYKDGLVGGLNMLKNSKRLQKC